MNINVMLTIIVSIALALLGYMFTYFNNLRLARRKDRLERVNKQLQDLYGPLFAIDQVTSILWKEFRRVYDPTGWKTAMKEPQAWRAWITEVFMPLNVDLVHLITEHADLLEETEMPEVLLKLCAHVNGYKPVIKAWESGDFSKNFSIITYPDELSEYAVERYKKLKQEQLNLLGKEKANK